MSPDQMINSQPGNPDEESYPNLEVQRLVLEALKEVTQEDENRAQLERMPQRYEMHFMLIGKAKADRCMDDRSPLEQFSDGNPTGFSEKTNSGAQFPGATGGFEDALIMAGATGNVWGIIEKAYQGDEGAQPLALTGMHIDDDHGSAQSQELIQARIANSGEIPSCGDQKLKLQGKVGYELTPEQIQERMDKAQVVIPLTQGHAKNAILILNTIPGNTYNTVQANNEVDHAFNIDLGEAYERAGLVYDIMKQDSDPLTEDKTREQFQLDTVKNMIRITISDAYGLVEGFQTAHVRTSAELAL